MATIFQKIFLSKKEVNLLNIIQKSNVQPMFASDDKHMFTTEQYNIDTKDIQITSTHNWHYAQGDFYKLTVQQNGEQNITETYKFAKRIFMHMRAKYRQQQM